MPLGLIKELPEGQRTLRGDLVVSVLAYSGEAAWGERMTIEMIALVAHYTLVGVLINGYAVEPRPGDGVTF